MVRVSVIIVNFNQYSLLHECLNSLRLTITSQDEVIVVDNSPDIARKMQFANEFPWVRLIPTTENLGFGGGNNLGVNYAQGEYLIFINPDTVVTEGWLESLISPLETDPKTGMVTPKILLKHDPTKINTCGNNIHISGLTLCRGLNKPDGNLKNFEEVTAISGAAFGIRRVFFMKLGGFDERFFMYMEDTDLSLRSRLAGKLCMYVPDSIVYHDYELRFGPNKTFYQERNRYLMLIKNFHILTLILLLPIMILSEILAWGFVLLRDRERWKNKIRSYNWIFHNWKEIMLDRKATQAFRKVKDRELILDHTYKLDFEQTETSLLTYGAHLFFDPLFFIFSRILYAVLWW